MAPDVGPPAPRSRPGGHPGGAHRAGRVLRSTGARPPGCWAGPPSSTPICGRAPAPSRTCGWRPGPRAWVSAGSRCSSPAIWPRLSGRPDGRRHPRAGSAWAGRTSGRRRPASSAGAGRPGCPSTTWSCAKRWPAARSRGPTPPPSRLAVPPAQSAVVAAHDRADRGPHRSWIARCPRPGRRQDLVAVGAADGWRLSRHRRRRPSGHRPRRLRLSRPRSPATSPRPRWRAARWARWPLESPASM